MMNPLSETVQRLFQEMRDANVGLLPHDDGKLYSHQPEVGTKGTHLWQDEMVEVRCDVNAIAREADKGRAEEIIGLWTKLASLCPKLKVHPVRGERSWEYYVDVALLPRFIRAACEGKQSALVFLAESRPHGDKWVDEREGDGSN